MRKQRLSIIVGLATIMFGCFFLGSYSHVFSKEGMSLPFFLLAVVFIASGVLNILQIKRTNILIVSTMVVSIIFFGYQVIRNAMSYMLKTGFEKVDARDRICLFALLTTFSVLCLIFFVY